MTDTDNLGSTAGNPDSASSNDPYAGKTVEDPEMGHAILRDREARVPKVGAVAPPFELPRADGSGSIALSDYKAKHRPVVLVFGSHT